MADYFRHWLEIGSKSDAKKLPKIFFVNWFRRGEDGRYLWPGFGENSRVLKWVFERIDGAAPAQRTEIGYLPPVEAIDVSSLSVAQGDLEAILSVDKQGWLNAVSQIKDHYARFGERIPDELNLSLAELERELVG